MRGICSLILAMGLFPLASFAAPTTPPLSLPIAQQQALADSPRLAQIEARYRAAQQLPAQAGSLPDPTLNLGLLSVPTDGFALDQEAMTQLQLGIVQPIPWFGKLSLAQSVASLGVQASAEEVTEARNGLQRDVARSWWTLFFLDHALAVVEQNLQRLREFNRIAQSRYRVGEGLQQDALQAQLELSTQLEQRLVLQGQRRVAQAQLNALLAQPAENPIELADPGPLDLAPLPQLSTLIDTALRDRPRMRQQRLMLDAADEKQALARKGLYPDLTLGAAYGYRQDAPNGRSRADLLSVTLGIKLPLYAASKQQREIDQRGAERIAQQQALYDTQLAVRSEVVQASSDYQRAREQAALLQQGMLPQARQTVASMLSGYQVGKVNFSTLIRAQLQVNRIQLQYWQALRDAQQARANLSAAVGVTIDE